MSVFPYSEVFIGPSRTIVISGPHIQILDSNSGLVSSSTVNFTGPEKDGVLKSGPVRCASLSPSGSFLVTAGDDKMMKVWEIDGLVLQSQRELPKRPTSIQFTTSDDTILVSDKFGDIFKYPLHPTGEPPKPKKDALSSHENPSGGELILGHTSFLTAFTLSRDQKYIITADRDEHIRVSWYPMGFNIEMYCLGHIKFVSTVHIPKFFPSTLISGGGDPMLKLWDWMSGVLLREIHILEDVLPYIKIRPQKKKRSDDDDDDDDQDKVGSSKGKRKKRRGQSEDKAQQGISEAKTKMDDVGTSMDMATTSTPIEEPATLVIHKIDSLENKDGKFVIFSAVGATALFSVNLSEDLSGEIKIDKFDFEKPVLDFTLVDDGLFWVSLDGQWGSESTGMTMVQVVRLVSGKFSPVTDENPLLAALNSTCLIPATPSDLKALDLYLPLTALPKNPDAEHNAMDRDITEFIPNPDDKGGKVGKKQMGRLKNKQKLMEKIKEVGGGVSTPASEGQDEDGEKQREEGDGDEEPESKKLKSVVGNSGSGEDVDMAES